MLWTILLIEGVLQLPAQAEARFVL